MLPPPELNPFFIIQFELLPMASSRRNFFIWLAGGDPEVLDAAMQSERRKFVKLGLTIMVPAVFAWGAMWFAAPYIGIENTQRIFLATIWSLIVLVIDSYLVSTLIKRNYPGSSWRYYAVAGFRLLVSIFIGIVISHPLVLRILDQNINEEVQDMKSERGLSIRAEYADTARVWTALLSHKIDSLEKDTKKYEQLKTAEINGDKITIDGLTTSGKRGKDISYGMFTDKITELNREHKLLADSVLFKRSALMAEAQARVRALDTTFLPDYLKRSIALERLKRFDTTGWVVWTLMILFVLLDSIAVIAKLLTPPGVYEEMLTDREELRYQQFISVNQLQYDKKIEMTRAIYARAAFHPPDVILRSVENIWNPVSTPAPANGLQQVSQRSFNQLSFLVASTLIGLGIWFLLDRYLPKEANGNISIFLGFYMSVCASYAGLKK